MARSQQELKTVLERVTDADAVYIQPPSVLKYTCILIDRDIDSDVTFADNIKYLDKHGYTITVVCRAPDDPVPDQVEALPYAKFNRRMVTANLYHFVYQLYF